MSSPDCHDREATPSLQLSALLSQYATDLRSVAVESVSDDRYLSLPLSLQAKLDNLVRLTNDVKRSLDNASGLRNCSTRSVRRIHPFTVPHFTTHDAPDESIQVGILHQRSSSFLGGDCSISPNYCDYNSPRSDEIDVDPSTLAMPSEIDDRSFRHTTLEQRKRPKLSSSDDSVSVNIMDDDYYIDHATIGSSSTDEEDEINNPPLVRQGSDLSAVIVDCTNQELSEEDNQSAPDSVVSSVEELSPSPPLPLLSNLIRPCSVIVEKVPLTASLRQTLSTDSATAESGGECNPTSPHSGVSDSSDSSNRLFIVQDSQSSTSALPLDIPLDLEAAGSLSEENDQSSIGETVACPACLREISWKRESIHSHSRLDVLVCEHCWRRFNHGKFVIDDNHEIYCTLCGDGGDLICCDDCEKAVCQNCLFQVYGDNRAIDFDDSSPWQCFCCDPSPLKKYSLQKRKIIQWFKEDARSKKKSKTKSASKSKPEKRRVIPTLTPKSKEFVDTSSDSDFDMATSRIDVDRYTSHSPASSQHSTNGKNRTHSSSSLQSSSKSKKSSTQSYNSHKAHPPASVRLGNSGRIHSSSSSSRTDSDDTTLKASSPSQLPFQTFLSQSLSDRSVKQREKKGKGKKSSRRRAEFVKVEKGSLSGKVRKREASIFDSSESEGLDVTLLTSDEMESTSSNDSTVLEPDLPKSTKQSHRAPNSHRKKKQTQPTALPKNHLMRSDYGIESSDDYHQTSDLNEMILTIKRRRVTSSSSSASSLIQPMKKRSLHDQLSSDSSNEELRETRTQLVITPEAQALSGSDDDANQSRSPTDNENPSYTVFYSSDSSSSDMLRPAQKSLSASRRKLLLSVNTSNDSSDFEDQNFLSSVAKVPSKVTKKKKRRRVKKFIDSEDDLSSSDETEGSDAEGKVPSTPSKRKDIRKVIPEAKLASETKLAKKAEKERLKRLEDKRKQLATTDEQEQLILEQDPESKEVLLQVRESLLSELKPHQREGIKFLYDNCCESIERLKSEAGSGAILAHCMGLGKTLQVIAVVDSLLVNVHLSGVERVLVVCPVNTLLNWRDEYEKWIPWNERDYHVFVLDDSPAKRHKKLMRWFRHGGVMLIGYEMYRSLAVGKRIKKKTVREDYAKCLLDPGPDIIVCDEGHVLKRESSNLSQVLSGIRTKRRIVLTGTPLQNNLMEYYCMVNFVKPNLLGNSKEFRNHFVNPISNGQHRDSRPSDVRTMKQRAHILFKLLSGCVDRKDYRILSQSLPPKHEYVISLRMSEVQGTLIKRYLQTSGDHTATGLFNTFANLLKVWNHPWVLKLDEARKRTRKENEELDMLDDEESSGSLKDFICDDSEDSCITSRESSVCALTRVSSSDSAVILVDSPPDKNPVEPDKKADSGSSASPPAAPTWYGDVLNESLAWDASISAKISFLFELLQEVERVKEKLLVFSQSLLILDYIEEFIKMPEHGGFIEGMEYLRIDGSTKVDLRSNFMKQFNKRSNDRLRLFLISTKAGSMGVNLIGANRVVIFDACWNPSHDLQSVFRTYRFGQTKPVFVYRLLAQGTMEEKIYDRQVTKQSLSMRVIDEKQIGRHYTFSQLSELFTYTPAPPPPTSPPEEPYKRPEEDIVLSQVLDKLQPHHVIDYHTHDSLLEHVYDEELSEEERKLAWDSYNNEKAMESKAYNAGLIGAQVQSFVQTPGASNAEFVAIAEQTSHQVLYRKVSDFITKYWQVAKELETLMLGRNAMMDSRAAGRPFNVSRFNNLMQVITARTTTMRALGTSLNHVPDSMLLIPEIRQLYEGLMNCVQRIDRYSIEYNQQIAALTNNAPRPAAASFQSSSHAHQ